MLLIKMVYILELANYLIGDFEKLKTVKNNNCEN